MIFGYGFFFWTNFFFHLRRKTIYFFGDKSKTILSFNFSITCSGSRGRNKDYFFSGSKTFFFLQKLETNFFSPKKSIAKAPPPRESNGCCLTPNTFRLIQKAGRLGKEMNFSLDQSSSDIIDNHMLMNQVSDKLPKNKKKLYIHVYANLYNYKTVVTTFLMLFGVSKLV